MVKSFVFNPPMLLDFNIDKAIAATAYVIGRDGGTSSMFVLIKKLYYSDRSALIAWGNSVTGDDLASLEKGPIVSNIYNLMKGEGPAEYQIKWDNFIQRIQPHDIVVRNEANIGILSERELEVLEQARLKINEIASRGSIAVWLHENCPEWEDPGGSSIPIDPSKILRLSHKSEEEIQRIERANDEFRFLDYLLNAG